MFKINSNEDTPNAEYLHYIINEATSKRGIRLGNKIFELRKNLSADVTELVETINNKYGISNPNSAPQVKTWMEHYLNPDELEVCSDDNGNVSSKKEFMVELAHMNNEFAIDLLTYRKTKKQLEAIESLLKACDNYGIIRPEVSLGNTNRINYKNPALMNIPKSILWDVITPMKDGDVLISADIKNQEPWILINWKEIDELKDVIRSNPNGLYNAIYVKIFGVEPNELQRKECKTAWNALTYGASKFGLKRICKNIDGEAIYKYFNSIEGLKKFKAESYKLANGKVRKTYTYFGTELHPDARFSSALQRQLMDFPIQGTGSDILSLLVEHIEDEREKRNIADDICIYYSRHDELIFEVSKDYIDKNGTDGAIKLVRELVEHQVDDWEPFNIEVNIVSSNNINRNLDDDIDED